MFVYVFVLLQIYMKKKKKIKKISLFSFSFEVPFFRWSCCLRVAALVMVAERWYCLHDTLNFIKRQTDKNYKKKKKNVKLNNMEGDVKQQVEFSFKSNHLLLLLLLASCNNGIKWQKIIRKLTLPVKIKRNTQTNV